MGQILDTRLTQARVSSISWKHQQGGSNIEDTNRKARGQHLHTAIALPIDTTIVC